MTLVLLCVALTALSFAAAWGLLVAGLRAGDHPGDTTLTAIAPAPDGRGIRVTVQNPGSGAVLIGASLRRRSLRLWCEAGCFVTVPRHTAREQLLARRHAVVSVLAGGETQTLFVPLSAPTRHRAELVLAIGEADRLRVIHRAVEAPQTSRAAPPHAGGRAPDRSPTTHDPASR